MKMRKGFALAVLVVVLITLALPVAVYAAEVVSDGFDPDSLVISGVALAPLISILISVLKSWVKVEKKYIPLINVALGGVAVLVVGVVNQGLTWPTALIMTLGVVLGSHAFHETFGHTMNILVEIFGKKSQSELPES
jgi:hypothetical protein